MDIALYDESSYLNWGRQGTVVLAEHGPLYAFWYHLLSSLEHDPIKLYYLNYRITTVLPAALIFLVLRLNRVTPIIALFCSFAFLFSPLNFVTIPRVCHLALAIILIGFVSLSLTKAPLSQAIALTISAVLASYVRPEFYVSCGLLGVTILLMFIIGGRKSFTIRNAALLCFGSFLAASLALVWGIPLSGGNRSMVAFGQHYSRNWVMWHHADTINPFTNWEAIIQHDFGTVTTPVSALLSNPLAVGHHVWANFLQLPRAMAKTIFGSFPSLNSTATILLLLSVGAAISVFGALIIYKRKGQFQLNHYVVAGVPRNIKRYIFEGSLILILLAPLILSVGFIGPDRHYLVMGCGISIVAIIILFFSARREPQYKNSYRKLVATCLVGFLVAYPCATLYRHFIREQPNLKTIRFLHSLKITEPVNVLEAEGGFGYYVGTNYNRIPEYEKNTGFNKFLHDRKINMIVLSNNLERDERFFSDPEWLKFLTNPQKFGFTQFRLPLADRSLLVNKALLL